MSLFHQRFDDLHCEFFVALQFVFYKLFVHNVQIIADNSHNLEKHEEPISLATKVGVVIGSVLVS